MKKRIDRTGVYIKEVKTKKDLRIFASFNEKMYRNVPQAKPDLAGLALLSIIKLTKNGTGTGYVLQELTL